MKKEQLKNVFVNSFLTVVAICMVLHLNSIANASESKGVKQQGLTKDIKINPDSVPDLSKRIKIQRQR